MVPQPGCGYQKPEELDSQTCPTFLQHDTVIYKCAGPHSWLSWDICGSWACPKRIVKFQNLVYSGIGQSQEQKGIYFSSGTRTLHGLTQTI